MSEHKPPSATRIPIQLYPEAKEQFDALHREMGSLNQSETVKRLVAFYRRNNEKVKV